MFVLKFNQPTVSTMFGYMGNPKGISVTNLTKLPIADTYGELKILDYTFVPPLVLNSRRIIGIATTGEGMTISLHIKKDEQQERNIKFFEDAIGIVKKLS